MMRRFFFSSLTLLSMAAFASEADAQRNNPLLVDPTGPYGTIDFSLITPADYEEAVKEGIKKHDEEIMMITSNSEKPDFKNTIVALDRAGTLLNKAIMALSNLNEALGDTALMNVMTNVTPLLSEHQANILLNEELWNRIKSVYDNRANIPGLTPEDKRLIDETYAGFALSGANLQGEARKRYREINTRLSDLSVKYSQNVTNDMKNPERRLWLKESQLGGLPGTIVSAARADAKEALEAQGKPDDESLYMISVFYPSYAPFMQYSTERDLREKLYKLNGSRNTGGEFDNSAILKEIANLRLELSQLMGKKNFAEYNLQHTMAATPERVTSFLEELRSAYDQPSKKELKEIEDFARKTEGESFVLQPWDYSFWSDKLKNERYSFNDEDMKPYFELNNTIEGVFGLATKLFGYTFNLNKDIPGYHPDVLVYEVNDRDGNLLGLLYADFFYRAGKSPGAWMTDFRCETKDDNGKKNIPFISIVCNFSKPVGNEAVLLTPYEVETFLHEFGHALHGLSSEAKYASLSGTNVYHDFVELFSQFNENYMTEKEFLDGFARHYKTGEKLPQQLIDNFLKSSQYGAAYAGMRQLGFGYLDMAYHTITSPLAEDVDVEVFEEKAQNPVRLFPAVPGCVTSTSFGHIFSGGYAAGYYGYKWAEALDADAFAAFKEKGIFDPATAERYHKMIQAGGTVDPMELYVEFRGKQPTSEALLRRDGILK